MKLCLCCKRTFADDAKTCPRCGEASFRVLKAKPAPPPPPPSRLKRVPKRRAKSKGDED